MAYVREWVLGLSTNLLSPTNKFCNVLNPETVSDSAQVVLKKSPEDQEVWKGEGGTVLQVKYDVNEK